MTEPQDAQQEQAQAAPPQAEQQTALRRSLRANRQFQLLWIGSTASAVGTQLTALAYPLIVLAFTGSPGKAGLVGGIGFAATLLLSLPAGVWVDRWDRRLVLLWCEAVRAAAIATVAVAMLNDWLTLTHLIAVAAVNGAASALFVPAREVAIRSVVAPEQLGIAYAQEHARIHGVTLAGPPLGGWMFGLGRSVPFVADAISYLVSLVSIALAKVPRRPEGGSAPSTGRTMRSDIAEAARWLWKQQLLRAICVLAMVVNLGASMMSLPTIVLVQERGGTSTVIGIVMAGAGVGGLLGSLLATRIAQLLSVNHLLLAICGLDAVLMLSMTAPFGPYWPGVTLLLTGLLSPALSIPVQVQLAQQTPPEMMARVQSLLGVTISAITPVAPVIGGYLTEGVGATLAIVIGSGMLAACCLGGALSPVLRRGPSEADSPAPVAGKS
ncbi:MFS transporter [Streptomyces noursei]|uniref:MFS transporter n=1 Tax=Streptomyces noursei TaxID=1971 RepID=UPI0030EFF83D